MKKLLLISIILGLFLSGCENEQSREILPDDENQGVSNQYQSLMDPFQADPAFFNDMRHRNGNTVERPIYFRAEGIIYQEEDPSECVVSSWKNIIEGEGTGSHVGLFTVRLSYCIGSGNPPTGKITAANGDEIEVMMIYQNPDPYYQSYIIIGGSGRFTGASGSYTLYGVVDVTTFTWKLEGGGVVSY
jgi:hypothetical protein